MNIIERPIYARLKSALADSRIIVITGMRRVGKTTTLHWLLEQIPSKNKLYLDLERLDQRAVFQEKNYDLVLDYLRSRGLDTTQPLTVALDEIQYVPNIPSVIKYLYDTYQIKFLLTGSSSYYLKNLFSESMAGRKIVFELYPLGFGEVLDFRGVPYHRRNSFAEMRFADAEYERLKGEYENYLQFGGLPNVVMETSPQVKREILQDILSSYISLDVQAMADFRKIGEMTQLLKVLALRIGNKMDQTKLAQVVGITRPTLAAYLEFLEKTYVIHRLPALASADRATVLSKKLYFYDNGIVNALAQPSEGALFENAVFNQLKFLGELSYLGKGNEYEIDFILDQKTALEAKVHPVQSDDLKLKRLAEKHALSEAWIIGRSPTPGFAHFVWGGSIL
jgi:predicted AAA+ superfamily ATPase